MIPSLQAPKKIKIKASNGTSQNFLCKPKDDLRKDARLTELASIINKCLKMDSDCNKRRLQIRTYVGYQNVFLIFFSSSSTGCDPFERG